MDLRTAGPPGDRRERRARRAVERLGVVLLAGLLLWAVAQALLAVSLLVGALLAALLLTALLQPLAGLLRRAGLPPALAAALTALALVTGLAAVGLLVWSRAVAQLGQLPPLLALAVDQARSWLVEGPLALDAEQVSELRDTVVGYLREAAPSPVAGAVTLLRVLSGALLAVFAVFFLLKDGPAMWRWALGWVPERRRVHARAAGDAAWSTLTGYVRGTVLVALGDAVGIALVLLLVGTQLWLSLAVLTFLGAFVPVVGATVAGAAAVLVTLVTEGGRDAVLVLAGVLLVQQLEGNVLQPLIMKRAVDLHPLAVLSAVTAGALVLGVVGALVAVPLTAVSYRVAVALRDLSDGPGAAAPEDVPAADGDYADLSAR